jgi:DNA gyrase subunit A
MLALVDQQPQVLNLKGILVQYIEYRKNIIIRRTKFELDKAEKRIHILEGLKIALRELTKIIKIIRESKDTETARNALIKAFKFTIIQAQAILDMRLHQLTSLEVKKIEEEYKGLLDLVKRLKEILGDPKKVMAIIKEEVLELKKKYGDERRTEIIAKAEDINVEDLIKEEDVIVTLSHAGYIKRIPISTYKAQRRGGKGITGMETKEEDFVEDLFITTTKDYLLFFTNKGNVFWLKVYEIPEAGRYSKGKAIINLIKIDQGEKITEAIAVKEFKDDLYLIMGTALGVVKNKTIGVLKSAFKRHHCYHT